MLLLTCPHCGPRDEIEFNCGGESHVARPLLDCSDEAWADYLFSHRNPKGVTYERWRHGYGCGRWFNVSRDTVSHRILVVYATTDARPGPTSPESFEPIVERVSR